MKNKKETRERNIVTSIVGSENDRCSRQYRAKINVERQAIMRYGVRENHGQID